MRESIDIGKLNLCISESALTGLVDKKLGKIIDHHFQLEHSLVSFNDIALFVDSSDYLFSYNADAFRLLYSELNTSSKTYLSLYPASGFDAIYCASRGVQATIAFRDDHSPRLFNANSELNDVGALELVAHADLQNCEARFETIGCICPGLIQLPGHNLAHNINGGVTGEDELGNAIGLIGKLLLESGTATLIGIGYYDDAIQEVSDKLTNLCSLHELSHKTIITTSFKMEPGNGASIFGVTVSNLCLNSNSDHIEIGEALYNHIKSLKIKNVCLFKSQIIKKSNDSANIVIDLSESYYGTWLI